MRNSLARGQLEFSALEGQSSAAAHDALCILFDAKNIEDHMAEFEVLHDDAVLTSSSLKSHFVHLLRATSGADVATPTDAVSGPQRTTGAELECMMAIRMRRTMRRVDICRHAWCMPATRSKAGRVVRMMCAMWFMPRG